MSRVSNTSLARATLAQLKSGKNMAQATKSLAAYLTLERRLGDSQAIIREVERILLSEDGKLYVHATSAFALSEVQMAEITKIFAEQTGAKDIIIHQTIDSDVIGGVRLQTADHQLDLTVQRQLQRLKHAKIELAHSAITD